MTLRPYQRRAVDAVETAVRDRAHPVAVLPTGSGKSLILAELARRAVARGQRVAVVTHRRELLAQDRAAIERLAPELEVGTVSAGLALDEPGRPVTFWGVATAHRRRDRLDPVDLVIVDEAHLVPREADTMYGAVLAALGGQRVGLTATPYRLDSGLLYEGDGALFDSVAIQVPARELVAQGWLAPLRAHLSAAELDLRGVRSRAGDFVTGDLEGVATTQTALEATVRAILSAGARRRSWLVFAVSVAHVTALAASLHEAGVAAAAVTGQTPVAERDALIEQFRSGELRALVNCEVLTTGFDAPGVDLLALVRPTTSRALHVQMLGRGMRIAEGKDDCLVLDLAGNVGRHGLGDEIVEIAVDERAATQRVATDVRPRSAPPPPRWLDVLGIRARWYEREGERRVVVAYQTVEGEIVTFLAPARRDLWARARIDVLLAARGLASRVGRDAISLVGAIRQAPPPTAVMVCDRPDRAGRIWTDVLAEAMPGEDRASPALAEAA